jgi:hypothetical protein
MVPLFQSAAPIGPAMTVRAAMARYPETYHVFHRFRMDGPWEAERTIEAVAAAHGRDPAAVLEALNGAVRTARHGSPVAAN